MRHVPYAMSLCSKVLAMVREMAALAARAQLDYAFMLDYDTVTDTTNPSPDPDPNPAPNPTLTLTLTPTLTRCRCCPRAQSIGPI